MLPVLPPATAKPSDALSRGNISHISQINRQAILSTRAPGTASGSENNCLIDSIRQVVGWKGDLKALRRSLNQRFRTGPEKIKAGDYLDFNAHGATILELMGEDPARYKLVCIDLGHNWDHRAVISDGELQRFIGNYGNCNFVPLLPCHSDWMQEKWARSYKAGRVSRRCEAFAQNPRFWTLGWKTMDFKTMQPWVSKPWFSKPWVSKLWGSKPLSQTANTFEHFILCL